MADHDGELAGIDAPCGEQRVAHHGPAANLMQDLGSARLHPGTGACRQNDDRGRSGILGDHVRALLAKLRWRFAVHARPEAVPAPNVILLNAPRTAVPPIGFEPILHGSKGRGAAITPERTVPWRAAGHK